MTYTQKYNKEHYKQFKVELKKETYNKLEEYLKKNNLSKAAFLRMSIDKFTNEK